MDKFKKLALIQSSLLFFLLIILIATLKITTFDEKANAQKRIVVTESIFGYLPNNQKVLKYNLKNAQDFEIEILTYGATLKTANVFDRYKRKLNLVLNFNNIEEYSNRSFNPYFGGIIGRVSNRISNAKFEIEGVNYQLDKNDGEACLHGGDHGFSWRNWNSLRLENGVKFFLTSSDGEGGFPGELLIEVTYLMSEDKNEFSIEYKAKTTKPTPIDLTNHAYFNLAGHDSKEKIYDHQFKIYSDYYLDADLNTILVTGKINSVSDTKFDFRDFTSLRSRIDLRGRWPEEGFDHYFINNQQSGQKIIASVRHPYTGIQLDIKSDQNGVQFYTSNFLNLTNRYSKYSMHGGFCLETHNYPDSVNKKMFPSSIVRPEGEYRQKTVYSFTTELH